MPQAWYEHIIIWHYMYGVHLSLDNSTIRVSYRIFLGGRKHCVRSMWNFFTLDILKYTFLRWNFSDSLLYLNFLATSIITLYFTIKATHLLLILMIIMGGGKGGEFQGGPLCMKLWPWSRSHATQRYYSMYHGLLSIRNSLIFHSTLIEATCTILLFY